VNLALNFTCCFSSFLGNIIGRCCSSVISCGVRIIAGSLVCCGSACGCDIIGDSLVCSSVILCGVRIITGSLVC
jgi:hypothetical protein